LKKCAILAAIMRPALFVSIVFIVASPVALLAQTCSQPPLRPFIHKVQAAQSQLRAYKLGGDEDEQLPSLQARIHAMKDAFAALADAAMKCAPGTLNAKAFENSLVKPLDANKPVVVEEYDPNKPEQLDHIYGDSIDVKVTRPAEQPQVLFIDFRFEIECGFDSILLAYEFRDSSWRRVLRWESPTYETISGAFGDFFEYVVLPKTASNNLLIAVAHGHPWCSSNLSKFDVDILQPMQNQAPQQVVFHKKAFYARGTDPLMKVEPDGFELRLDEFNSDINIIIRPVIYRFRVSGKDVVRIQPIANNGRDFVDVWLEAPWTDAERWSTSSEVARLEATHKTIGVLNDPKKIHEWDFTFGPVRPCSDSSSHFQVEFDQRWPDQPKHPNKPTFFQIKEGKNSFTMLSASDKPDTHCTGQDIMPPK